ncbi:MAG: late competence development ComFB family protein [Cyanobacteria bacterium P01_H01_bin.162]
MGSVSKTAHPKLYINVMELLVAEEVGRQLAGLPERVSKYVKRTEVETFALNRLPALYASSEKGLQHQYEHAQHDLRAEILSAVRQAFAAVQVDPIRLSQPLQLNQEEEAVLQALRELLKEPNLDWKSALREIQRIQDRRQSEAVKPRPAAARPVAPKPQPISGEDPHHTTAWRPGTYGSRVSWRPRESPSSSDEGFRDNAL